MITLAIITCVIIAAYVALVVAAFLAMEDEQ